MAKDFKWVNGEKVFLTDKEQAVFDAGKNQPLTLEEIRGLRRAEYPDIGDQLDAIMKWVAGENEITVTPELKSLAMTCMSVKAKYPKPQEE